VTPSGTLRLNCLFVAGVKPRKTLDTMEQYCHDHVVTCMPPEYIAYKYLKMVALSTGITR